MIAKVGKTTGLEILNFECLSTDNIEVLITNGTVTRSNIGSSVFNVDTSDVYKLNTDATGVTLKWYKL